MDSATSLRDRPLPRRTKVAASTLSRVLRLVLGTMLIGGITLSSCSYAAPRHQRKTISHAASDDEAILEAAIKYCFRDADSEEINRPWICYISTNEDNIASILTKKFRHLGIQVEPPEIQASTTWPKHFWYVSLGTIQRLSSKRVRLSVGEDSRVDPEVIDESTGLLYLDYKRRRWRVDENASYFRSGD